MGSILQAYLRPPHPSPRPPHPSQPTSHVSCRTMHERSARTASYDHSPSKSCPAGTRSDDDATRTVLRGRRSERRGIATGLARGFVHASSTRASQHRVGHPTSCGATASRTYQARLAANHTPGSLDQRSSRRSSGFLARSSRSHWPCRRFSCTCVAAARPASVHVHGDTVIIWDGGTRNSG
ncbi:hypothetical protein OH76DRAFT_312971 [Lentinus brumalis]|uniref:Uncharacterized protein n=1 Tax=Lentinus brumalis TaxID=2498619 RepID=A0A371CK02_9APHY|nr:hypothetical protein OH76DRAFT_312971 [Polyporus brumalis]